MHVVGCTCLEEMRKTWSYWLRHREAQWCQNSPDCPQPCYGFTFANRHNFPPDWDEFWRFCSVSVFFNQTVFDGLPYSATNQTLCYIFSDSNGIWRACSDSTSFGKDRSWRSLSFSMVAFGLAEAVYHFQSDLTLGLSHINKKNPLKTSTCMGWHFNANVYSIYSRSDISRLHSVTSKKPPLLMRLHLGCRIPLCP